MGRPRINPVPAAKLDEVFSCSRCGENHPGSMFYWSKGGNRNTWCRKCYREWQEEKAAAGAFRVPWLHRACSHCGVEFYTRQSRKVYCNRDCNEAAQKARDKARRLESKPDRTCIHCGAPMPRSMRVNAKFCSERCNSRAHHLKRGNGRLGPGRRREIERAYIIERDKGICHICDKRCAPDEIHLDHLVPLSAGGSHDPSNLRVAHAACNLSKREEARNDQLMLVG